MLRGGWSTALPRLLLGLIFVVSAADGFYFVATGAELMSFPNSDKGRLLVDALRGSGFFWPFMKAIDLVGGLSLLTGIHAPVGLLLLLPIIATIILFHLAINPPGLVAAAVLAVLTGWLLLRYKSVYARLLAEAD